MITFIVSVWMIGQNLNCEIRKSSLFSRILGFLEMNVFQSRETWYKYDDNHVCLMLRVIHFYYRGFFLLCWDFKSVGTIEIIAMRSIACLANNTRIIRLTAWVYRWNMWVNGEKRNNWNDLYRNRQSGMQYSITNRRVIIQRI